MMQDKELQFEEEFIDLRSVVYNYLRILLKTWFVLILLCAGLAIGLIRYKQISSVNNNYMASAIYTVERGSDIYANATVAKRLASGVSVLSSTSDFRAQLDEVLGRSVSGYSFYGTATSSSNLITISVYTYDKELANELIEAFDQTYPSWIMKSIGNCSFIRKDVTLSTGLAPQSWNKWKMLAMGVMGGCFIWFVFATLHILFVRKVHNENDLHQVTGILCLGALPDTKKKKRGKSKKETLLMTEKHIDPGYRQSLRSLRQQVDQLLADKKQVVMITSTDTSEGKSLLTLNLAYAMKSRKKKVAVIDTDYYKQGMKSLLALEETGTTLMDYMADLQKELAPLVEVNGISVLCAGEMQEKNINYLNAYRLKEVIDQLRKEYDIILMDTAPVNPVGDALIFSEAVDSVLYVVRCEYAMVRDVMKGMESFYRNGKLAGYVLNRVKTSQNDLASYYYGYRYGYGKYGKYNHYGTYKHYGNEEEMQDWEE